MVTNTINVFPFWELISNEKMINRIAFQNKLHSNNLFRKTNPYQLRGLFCIIDKWESNILYKDKRWLAYMMATAYHETWFTMEPIEEVGKGAGRPYGKRIKQSGKPYTNTENIFYGRGFVQLTWYENYSKFSSILGIDLIENPSLALNMKVATDIMFHGMTKGLFTGVNLSRYFNEQREDWVSARKIINGTDKAELIAVYAKKFLNCIV